MVRIRNQKNLLWWKLCKTK